MRTNSATHLGRLGVARQNNFELVIPGYDITLAIKKSPIPKMSTEQIEVNYANQKVFLAGRTTSDGTMGVALHQLMDADVVGTLVAWREKVANSKTGAAGRAKDYKVDGYVTQYDPSGEVVLGKWIIEGMFPLEVDLGDGDYSSGDAVEVSLSLSYDRVYREDYDKVQPTQIV